MVGLRVVLGLLVGHQAVVMAVQEQERRQKYAAAWAESRFRRKPLLVVGGPLGSNPLRQLFPMKAHGYGDVCTDIEPAACRGAERFVEADIRHLPFADGEFGVSFNSHVLEHLPTLEDCQQAWGELHRVSDRVFTCLPSRQSVIAWAIPSHHLWVREVADRTLEVEERGGARRRAYVRPRFEGGLTNH